MSDELRLPDGLAACEARLAALPLAASRIDRDELLYRAGWAAAEAARATVNPPLAKGGARSGRLVAWSAASATLAASLAVAVTLALQPQAGGPRVAAVHEAPRSIVASPQAENPDAARRKVANLRAIAQLDALASGRSNVGGRVPSAALLATLGDRGRGRWDQPILISTTSTSSNDAPPREPATARQMLNEYLPGAAPSAVAPGADPRAGLLKILNPSTWSVDAI